jgi:hypothetical protein
MDLLGRLSVLHLDLLDTSMKHQVPVATTRCSRSHYLYVELRGG